MVSAERAKDLRRAPVVIEGGRSTWAIYTIEHENRDGLAAHLMKKRYLGRSEDLL